MSTRPLPPPAHTLPRLVEVVREQIADLAETPLWALSPSEVSAALTAATALVAATQELEARLAHQAESVEVGGDRGLSTAAWWAHDTQQTRAATHRKLRLGAALDTYADLRSALAHGDAVLEQAEVIVRALEILPADLAPAALSQAERHLVVLARDHDAKQLKFLGRRILEVIDPDLADAHDAKVLEREEREAQDASRLTISDDGHGKVHGRFTLPSAQGAMLKKMLLAIAAPKHRVAVDGALGERLPGPQRMGRAFGELIERYPADELALAGGVSATVVVTMDISTLLGGLKNVSLDTGEPITASLARRMACEAGIIPAVLGGKSQVLDLGRKRRFHTKSQRIALGLEQGGCTVDGCDWPPGMCHAHHEVSWTRDGVTSVTNGRLLCPRHHARAHDPTFAMAKLPGGKVAFTRRT